MKSIEKISLKDLKNLKGKKLFSAIEEIKNNVICEGYSYLSNSAKTLFYQIKLKYSDELTFSYPKSEESYYGNVREGKRIIDKNIPLEKDMLDYFSTRLIKLIENECEIDTYRDLFYSVILSDGTPFISLLHDEIFQYKDLLYINYDLENSLKSFGRNKYFPNFYKRLNDVIYFSKYEKSIIHFDVTNIIIEDIYQNDENSKLFLKTNFELIEIGTDGSDWGNKYFNTDDNIKDFIGKKILKIEISESDNDIEFLRIQTTDNYWLVFSLHNGEYYKRGFASKSKIYSFFVNDIR